jgi:glucan 1,3-beta-glucosidase
VECSWKRCPDPYFGVGQVPNAPPNDSYPPQDPFGTGGPSFVSHGMCPIDKIWENEIDVVRSLSFAQLHSFDTHTHGFFFWNFRTELETRWDFFKVRSVKPTV